MVGYKKPEVLEENIKYKQKKIIGQEVEESF